MPGLLVNGAGDRKRKRALESTDSGKSKSRKAPKKTSTEDVEAHILSLEAQISDSREHYNNLIELQKYLSDINQQPRIAILAAVALCRSFARLIADERLAKHRVSTEAETQIVKWLRERLHDFRDTLNAWIGSADASQENTALTLLMRIVKSEISGTGSAADHAWRSEKFTFYNLVQALVSRDGADGARQQFVDTFVEEHDDVRFYTFVALKKSIRAINDSGESNVHNVLDLLSHMEGVPESENQLEDWYGALPDAGKHPLLSLGAHRKAARETWLAVFRSTLTQDGRKIILNMMKAQILPWFVHHLELLADFLTDSFNHGGSISLLALNGIFHLMTERNLDYPDFYTKLYSLLDQDILHSKHRSRFFRLFETFMSSTHLPAAMVASFVKRLSRLALQAPPGAIVWIIPWVYNILKQHPPCTFMLHRPKHHAHAIYASNPNLEEEGIDDPYDMQQVDPMLTGAIDSSLWELETLRQHYHPNIATLAKILGDQFTKRDYALEDFLDHSYASLIDAELGKEMKKAPVVEWEIPKRIVTAEEGGLNELGNALQRAMDAVK